MSLKVVHEAPPAPAPRLLVPRDRLVRLPQVIEMTGCQKSTIYGLMKRGAFPKNIAVTRRMSAWPETAVLQWVQDRINGAGAA